MIQRLTLRTAQCSTSWDKNSPRHLFRSQFHSTLRRTAAAAAMARVCGGPSAPVVLGTCSRNSSPSLFLCSSGISTSYSRTGSRFQPLRAAAAARGGPRVGLLRIRVRAARTESSGVSLGFRAPYFELPEPLTGNIVTLDDFEGSPALLVMFICNHCPFVKHLKKEITKLTKFYMKKGLAVVAISSNSTITHPQDGPEFMAEEAKLFDYPFPYLFDESQEVARAFGATCTPEFFLFKKDGRRPFELVYHGQFDDSRPSSNMPVTGRDLSRAIDCVLSAQKLLEKQKPSVGCSIKWHPS